MAKSPDDWEHTGDSWRLVIYEYDGWIEYKGQRFNHHPGTVLILPPRSHFKQDRYAQELQVMYSNFLLADSTNEMMALPLISSLGDAFDRRREDWLRCMRRMNISVMPSKAMLFQLLWLLAEPLSKYRRHPAVDAAEEIFERRLGEAFSMHELTKETGVSQNQLIRLFRQEHGMTPVGFLRNRRAEEARKLLTTTSTPIKEIAALVGVPNLHYFNAFLREYFGCGPRELREREGVVKVRMSMDDTMASASRTDLSPV
jgi:AraC-like DNA-binding protein